ncbi:MAG: tetratricopeptide repeat protein [Desulfobacteraceae bacterium]
MPLRSKARFWLLTLLGMTGLTLIIVCLALAQPRPMAEDILTPLSLGYDEMKAGNTEAAQYQFEKVLKGDPDNPYALNNLAVILERQGKFKEAMAYLLQAETHAKDYLQKPDEICDIGGICMAIKPSRLASGESSIAPLVHGNINLLKIKIGKQKY